jgi:ankyrin repeat protein
MIEPYPDNSPLMKLVLTIANGDAAAAVCLLGASPRLAKAQLQVGATRQTAKTFFIYKIQRYLSAGDTALHIAASAYSPAMVGALIAAGAEIDAKNRRDATPLHAAASGSPGSQKWNPHAQAATIACLIEAGADPNAGNKDGATPLHIAVRTRCAAAVKALLAGGADALRRNKGGSTPMRLATLTTGRGGSGTPEAKAQQREILILLDRYGAARE